MSLYLLMITVTLAHIQAVSGHLPFDMRPFGYGPIEVAALLDSLGAEGRAYYLGRQIPLDTVYPAMLALTLMSTLLWFGQHMTNRWPIHVGVILATGSALLDYVENLGILAMIRSWPEVSVPLVYAVSTATILKSIATTLTVVLVLLAGFDWARHAKRKQSPMAR